VPVVYDEIEYFSDETKAYPYKPRKNSFGGFPVIYKDEEDNF